MGKLFGLRFRDGPIGRTIAFVADQQFRRPFGRVPIDFFQPIADVIETFGRRGIVHHNDAIRTAVIGRCDGPEPFLSRGIPNLQLDRLIVNFDRPETKIHTNGANVRFRKRIVLKNQKRETRRESERE